MIRCRVRRSRSRTASFTSATTPATPSLRSTRRPARSYGHRAAELGQRRYRDRQRHGLRQRRLTESLLLLQPAPSSKSRKKAVEARPYRSTAEGIRRATNVSMLGRSGGRDERVNEPHRVAAASPVFETRIRVDEGAADDDAVGMRRDLAHLRGTAQAEADR